MKIIFFSLLLFLILMLAGFNSHYSPSNFYSTEDYIWEQRNSGTTIKASEKHRLLNNGEYYTWSKYRREYKNNEFIYIEAGEKWRLNSKISLSTVEKIKLLIKQFITLKPAPCKTIAAEGQTYYWKSKINASEFEYCLSSETLDKTPSVILEIEKLITTSAISGAVPLNQKE